MRPTPVDQGDSREPRLFGGESKRGSCERDVFELRRLVVDSRTPNAIPRAAAACCCLLLLLRLLAAAGVPGFRTRPPLGLLPPWSRSMRVTLASENPPNGLPCTASLSASLSLPKTSARKTIRKRSNIERDIYTNAVLVALTISPSGRNFFFYFHGRF